MDSLKAPPDIGYGLLEPSETETMADLLAEAFSHYDPPAVAVGLSYAEIQQLVRAFVPKALSEQLSVVARESSTGALLGVLLAQDFGTPPPSGLEEVAPRFAPIGALLDGLDDQYRASRTIVRGTHLHLFMVGVAQRASNRGIAGNLISTCMTNGRSRGYTTAVTEATGSVSQHVFRKLGFDALYVALYKDFMFNDEAVFSSIVGPEGTVLMERELRGAGPGRSRGC